MKTLTDLVIAIKKRLSHKKIESKDIRLTLEELSDLLLEEGAEDIRKLFFRVGMRRMKGDEYE